MTMSCCTAVQQAQNSSSQLKSDLKKPMSIQELKERYSGARSDSERRLVCLQAIDQGAIHPGAPVAAIDEIFGTRFASSLAATSDIRRRDMILFAPQTYRAPTSERFPVGIADVGWYMAFEYDQKGVIQNYYLSNIQKGGSRRTDGKKPLPAEVLQEKYAAASSQEERRDVCLKAIDEGVIQTFGPVHVSMIDTLFGTHLASKLPTKSERTKWSRVYFSPLAGSESSDSEQSWFLAVEYAFDGTLQDYYVSNVWK
jgi:hypothetical protein